MVATQEENHRPPVLRPMAKDPVFLVGAERSGTTLARLMLDHHPRIAWLNEFEYAVDLIGPQGWPDVNAYCDYLETNRIFAATGFQVDRSLSYPQLVKSFLDQKREATGKELVGATVHRHFDRLLRIWPNARFIHLVRDGRDVARSCIGMGWAGNVYTGVQRWIEVETLWDRLKTTLADDRYVEITYLNLTRGPEDVLRRICGFLGVEYDPRMLEYDKHTSYEPPNPKLAQQWRRKMPSRDIQLVESRIADLLVARGYELSGLPPIRPSALERLYLRLQDRLARCAFRVRRYGWRLWLATVIARRVGTRGWKRRLTLRCNEIDRKYLK